MTSWIRLSWRNLSLRAQIACSSIKICVAVASARRSGAQKHRLEPAPTPPQSWRVVVVTKLVPVQIIRRSSRPGQGDLTVVYDRCQVVIAYSWECKPYGHLGA
ncbi:hypothetical protein CI102_1200 [Trichoderma harzianum]|nr:hypothetical protein CI102_1200 [Trichoderma harzianum]